MIVSLQLQNNKNLTFLLYNNILYSNIIVRKQKFLLHYNDDNIIVKDNYNKIKKFKYHKKNLYNIIYENIKTYYDNIVYKKIYYRLYLLFIILCNSYYEYNKK